MNIVLEGPDGGGKSTLAKFLSQALHRPIQASEGPPKFPGEINQRIERYLNYKDVIFDRHPVISQTVYTSIRASHKDNELPDAVLVHEFYTKPNVFIYCRSTHLPIDHDVKEHDTPEHLMQVQEHYTRLVDMYDSWALQNAHVIYTRGGPYWPIVHYVRAHLEVIRPWTSS